MLNLKRVVFVVLVTLMLPSTASGAVLRTEDIWVAQ